MPLGHTMMRGHLSVAWILRNIVATNSWLTDKRWFEHGCCTRMYESLKGFPRCTRQRVLQVSVVAFFFAVIKERAKLRTSQCAAGVRYSLQQGIQIKRGAQRLSE